MKTLLKEYRKLLLIIALPYLFIVVASIIRVDYDITAPGDLNEVREVISVETDYQQKGSINTVSVYTSDRTTLLTYLISLLIRNGSRGIASFIHLSERKLSLRDNPKCQYNHSLIAAYRSAGKEIKTVFKGMIIHTTTTDKADWPVYQHIITEWEGTPITGGILCPI